MVPMIWGSEEPDFEVGLAEFALKANTQENLALGSGLGVVGEDVDFPAVDVLGRGQSPGCQAAHRADISRQRRVYSEGRFLNEQVGVLAGAAPGQGDGFGAGGRGHFGGVQGGWEIRHCEFEGQRGEGFSEVFIGASEEC